MKILYTIFIIIILGLALFKFVKIFAALKKQNQQTVDLLFLIIFFILLFLPMSRIDNNWISINENRVLAAYKPLFSGNKTINLNYGADFDKWFNDRFYLRNFYIAIYYNLQYLMYDVIQTSRGIFNKQNNWMFNGDYKPEHYLTYFSAKIPLFKQDIEKFNRFCNANNIKLYVLIAPMSGDIYYDKIPTHINSSVAKTRIRDVYHLKHITKANIIFPYKEIYNESQKDFTHFKADIHWTDRGAYIAYRELMEIVKKDFPNIRISEESDYNISYSNRIVGDIERYYFSGWTLHNIFHMFEWNADKILDVTYKYYTHKNAHLLKSKIYNQKFKRGEDTYYPEGNDLRILEIGTSMNENLKQYLQYTARNVKYIRLNAVEGIPQADEFKIMKNYKQEILDFKPDIIVMCISIHNLNKFYQILEEGN